MQLQNRLLPQLKCTPKKTLLKADTLKDGISPLVAESALFCLSFVPKQIHSFFSGLEMMHKGLQSHPAHRKPYRSLRKRSELSYTTCFHWEFICSLGDLSLQDSCSWFALGPSWDSKKSEELSPKLLASLFYEHTLLLSRQSIQTRCF